MRLLTWNCNGGDYARRRKAISHYAADVEVLSEVLELKGLPPGRSVWAGERAAVGRRHKGVGVVVREGLSVTQLDDGSDPTWTATRVEGLATPLNVVGIWSRPPYEEPTAMALRRAAELLKGNPFIAAGDFNTNGYAHWARKRRFGFRQLIEEIEGTHQLKSAYHLDRDVAYGSEVEPTLYWYRKRDRPYHIDFVFIPSAWRPHLLGVEVVPYDDLQEWSDHRPVVAVIGDRVHSQELVAG